MNKALERPLKWHQEKFYATKEQQVRCYLLFQMTEDGEEHNRFFPYTKEGHKAALALAKKLGQSPDRIQATSEKLKWILPYGVRSVEEYEKWCKEWGIA